MKFFLQIQSKAQAAAGRLALFGILTGLPGFAGVLLAEAPVQQTAGKPGGKQAIPMVTATSGKPAWLTDLSLGIRESYDSNVYMGGAAQQYMPSGKTLKNISSWVTTISPKIGFNFAPLLGDQKIIQTLSFVYSPDFAIYTNQTSETNEAHRFSTALKGKAGSFTFSLENGFTYIDGNREAPVYPGNYRSAYATAVPRERRDQDQDRSKVFFQYDYGKWFARPVATLLLYNLNTHLKNPGLKSTPNGYQNYADRYDINGGLDIGYKLFPELAATVGYRYGYQYQQAFGWPGSGGATASLVPFSSPSNYQRVLFGAEGKIWKWLKIQFQMGPDFRTYAANTSTRTTPVYNLNPVVFYGEANITAEITSKDTLAFLFKDWRWVSSTGQIPYQDCTYDLTYTRKLSKKLSFSLQGRALDSDYTCATGTNGQRDDWMATVAASLRYNFNSNFSADLAYSANWGINGYDDLPAKQLPASKREFFENLVSIGAQVKF